MKLNRWALALSPLVLLAASCSAASIGESSARTASNSAFKTAEIARFDEPWAMAEVPGTGVVFVTERKGTIKGVEPNGRIVFVTGLPSVDYGGQGGLGDIAFLPSEAATYLNSRTIYLSWAEPGQGETRGAVVGRGRMVCEEHQTCDIRSLQVIWRQSPKVTGRGHYSHRIAISPDGKYLFIASGERQKFTPAQDMAQNLGKIVRLNLDGTPAAGNPFANPGPLARIGEATAQIWTLGHRNILGLHFDAQGRLWDLEHGPQGGDELNLVKRGQNYGWPLVSNGDHYGGKPIPRHSTRPDLAAPAISWNPVIAPGEFIFYSGAMFPEWRGQAVIAGLGCACLVRVGIEGETAKELARYPMDNRIREIREASDGSIWVLEDGDNARLLRLTAPR